MKILITGGLGFIGSNLAARLLEIGAEVYIIDSLIPEYGGNLFNVEEIQDRIHVNISDIRDQYSMRYLVQDMDYIFNFAGQTSHLDSMQNPVNDLEINAKAQLALLEACRHYNPAVKIIFASTRQIYGKPNYLPVDEKHPINPVDVNGVNKSAGESFHKLYHEVYGIKTCSLRLTNTFGPRMRIKDARQTFVGIWIKKIIEGQQFEVWGGNQIRDFTYIADLLELFVLLLRDENCWGKVYNVGGSESISLINLAKLLTSTEHKGAFELKEFPEERKKIDIGDYYSDDSLLRKDLSWKPKYSLKEGLKETLDYYSKFFSHYV